MIIKYFKYLCHDFFCSKYINDFFFFLLKKVNDVISGGKFATIKTWSRKSTILPNFVGLTFSVHNGKS